MTDYSVIAQIGKVQDQSYIVSGRETRPRRTAVRHVPPDNILLDYCRASIIEAKDESEDFLSGGWTIRAAQIRS